MVISRKYRCFLKWWYPQNNPKWSFLVGKPMVVGYHHFSKPPYCVVNDSVGLMRPSWKGWKNKSWREGKRNSSSYRVKKKNRTLWSLTMDLMDRFLDELIWWISHQSHVLLYRCMMYVYSNTVDIYIYTSTIWVLPSWSSKKPFGVATKAIQDHTFRSWKGS